MGHCCRFQHRTPGAYAFYGPWEIHFYCPNVFVLRKRKKEKRSPCFPVKQYLILVPAWVFLKKTATRKSALSKERLCSGGLGSQIWESHVGFGVWGCCRGLVRVIQLTWGVSACFQGLYSLIRQEKMDSPKLQKGRWWQLRRAEFLHSAGARPQEKERGFMADLTWWECGLSGRA